jgi:signal transduction histidine kinase
MKRPQWKSLRLRLTLLYGSLFFAAGLVLLGVTYVLVDHRTGEPDRKFSVQVTSQGTAPNPAGLPGGGPGTGNGAVIVRTDTGEALTPGEAVGYFESQQQLLHAQTMSSLLTQGGIALGLVGVVAIAFGWLIAGRVLSPLHQVTETARRIAYAPAADRNLHLRIALDGPHDEVKELADTFDIMVERLDKSFDGQRRFVANASHELRTPLTLNRALVEVAMHRRTASQDVQQLGETLLEINTRQERLIEGLLMLARSDNEIVDRTEVDLADVVSHVLAQAAAEAATAQVRLDERAYTALTNGDPVLLERLVQNLVENGIRHNRPEGGFVRVMSRTRPDGQVEVEVASSGAIVPPYEVPNLFEPFRRLGVERLVTAKGAGLGLSIVRSVARAHGGDVTARPRDGGGLIVTAVLPGTPRFRQDQG